MQDTVVFTVSNTSRQGSKCLRSGNVSLLFVVANWKNSDKILPNSLEVYLLCHEH